MSMIEVRKSTVDRPRRSIEARITLKQGGSFRLAYAQRSDPSRTSVMYRAPMTSKRVSRTGPTQERLSHLLSTSAEWSASLEIDPPRADAVDRVRAILDLMPVGFADAHIRLFPSEHAGITLQTTEKADLRMVDVDPGGFIATLVDERGGAREYALASPTAAVSFLTQH